MPLRQPVSHALPRRWLMTDERMGEQLWQAVANLPQGGGIVFRHYATPLAERRALFARLAQIAEARTLMLIRAGSVRLAEHEGGVHGRDAVARRGAIRTWPAHNRAEALAGVRAGAHLLFVSPVFATRSHPDAQALGAARAAAIIRGIDIPVVALGGVDETRFALLQRQGFYGWAGIDAWLTPGVHRQKRKAVPI